jgi:hypothetical protein
MTMLSTLTAIKEIETVLESVTDVDVERAARSFGKVDRGETPIGVAHDMASRRMWAAAFVFERRQVEAAAKAKFEATTDEETASMTAEAMRNDSLADLARQIFWTTVKTDVGGWDKPEGGSIGLRADWMLVYVSRPAAGLLRALGLIPQE